MASCIRGSKVCTIDQTCTQCGDSVGQQIVFDKPVVDEDVMRGADLERVPSLCFECSTVRTVTPADYEVKITAEDVVGWGTKSRDERIETVNSWVLRAGLSLTEYPYMTFHIMDMMRTHFPTRFPNIFGLIKK